MKYKFTTYSQAITKFIYQIIGKNLRVIQGNYNDLQSRLTDIPIV